MENKEVYDMVKKVDEFKEGILDLTMDEDLSIGLMNLVSIEEHLYFTYIKTEDDKYLNMLDSVRRTRIKFLKKIIKDPQGEEWCISKHLLSSSMRLLEVGNKLMSNDEKNEAKEFYNSSFDLYSLFFEINQKHKNFDKPKTSKSKPFVAKEENRNISVKKEIKVEKQSKISNFKSYLKQKLDCCKEI